MDGRRMMLAGSVITAAATVAVGGFVAVSSAIALGDSAGRALAVSPIVVPAAPATPAPATTAASAAATPAVAVAMPETVPAPEPEDVAAVAPEEPVPAAPAPAAPAADVPDFGSDASQALQRARDWAAAQGWDAARIEALIAQLQAQYGGRWSQPKTPVDPTGRQAVPESPSSRFGYEDEQSPDDSP